MERDKQASQTNALLCLYVICWSIIITSTSWVLTLWQALFLSFYIHCLLEFSQQSKVGSTIISILQMWVQGSSPCSGGVCSNRVGTVHLWLSYIPHFEETMESFNLRVQRSSPCVSCVFKLHSVTWGTQQPLSPLHALLWNKGCKKHLLPSWT